MKNKLFILIVMSFFSWFDSYAQDLTITSSQSLGQGTYNNLTINGADITVTLTGTVSVNGILTLTNGIILTSSTNLLVLGASVIVSGGNFKSYIDGPMSVTWPATGTDVKKTFPIGKATKYRPLGISLVSASSQVIRGEVFIGNCGGVAGTGLAAISTHLYFTTLVTNGVAGTGSASLGYMEEDSVKDSKSICVARSTTINGEYNSIGGSGLTFSSGSNPGEVPSTAYTVGNATDFLVHATTNATKNPISGVEFVGTVPSQFRLAQNYPNPFNPTTTIEFTVPTNGYTTLTVFNLIGQKVATLVSGMVKAGYLNTVQFDGSQLSSGIYYAQLTHDGRQLLQKIMLLK